MDFLAAGARQRGLAATAILPRLRDFKDTITDLGATQAMMTGSGTAMFGIWDSTRSARSGVAELQSRGWWARQAQALDVIPPVLSEDE